MARRDMTRKLPAWIADGIGHMELTRGGVALCDEADFEMLAQHQWAMQPSGTGRVKYAVRTTHANGRRLHLRMHRVLAGLEVGDPRQVDHKNHDGLDNRRVNLRVCEAGENNCNTRKAPGLTSRYKGVTGITRYGYQQWVVKIERARRRHYLGVFTDEIEAARAYDEAAKQLHGEFAILNFPQERAA